MSYLWKNEYKKKNVNLPNVMQFFALCEILEITDINKTFQMGNKENLFSRLNAAEKI